MDRGVCVCSTGNSSERSLDCDIHRDTLFPSVSARAFRASMHPLHVLNHGGIRGVPEGTEMFLNLFLLWLKPQFSRCQYKSSKLAKKASISTGLCLSHPPRNPAMGSLGLSLPLHGCLLMKEPHASLLFIEEFVSLFLVSSCRWRTSAQIVLNGFRLLGHSSFLCAECGGTSAMWHFHEHEQAVKTSTATCHHCVPCLVSQMWLVGSDLV